MQYDIIGSKNKLITKCKQKHNNDVVMIQSQNEASTVLQLNVFTTNYNVMKPLQCICYFQPTIF